MRELLEDDDDKRIEASKEVLEKAKKMVSQSDNNETYLAISDVLEYMLSKCPFCIRYYFIWWVM